MQDEKENLLYRFNQTSYFPYTPQHIMDLFHDKVARFPERVALMEGRGTDLCAGQRKSEPIG